MEIWLEFQYKLFFLLGSHDFFCSAATDINFE